IGLLTSIPHSDEDVEGDLPVITGPEPSPSDLPEGCSFAPRCPFAIDMCLDRTAELMNDDSGNAERCWVYGDEWNGHPEQEVMIRGERTAQSNEFKKTLSD